METLVSAGILSVAISGVSTILVFGYQSYQGLNARGAATNSANELRSVLQVRSLCKANFKGLEVALGGAPKEPTVEKVQYFDTSGKPTGNVLQVGVAIGPFQASSIQIKPRIEIASGQIMADLVITSPESLGSSAISRSIPLQLDMVNGKIDSCIAGVETDLELKQKSCAIGSDGVYQWSEVDGECVDNRLWEDFPGTHSSASCGTGYSLDWGGCWAKEPPGWVEPIIGPPRTYSDGSVDTTPPNVYWCEHNIQAKSCTCDYAVDGDAGGFTAVATCYKEN